ncbi:MAG TPA: hypothetical protein VLT36_10915 [Candidatus Dormibacteraeota bacterium]|nr:hypothetical protein [Candidatus Dormibacteraeota bacterium]
MLIKCICKNCAGHLEFEEENAGQEIECPHCGFDTKLFLPGGDSEDMPRVGLLTRLRSRRQLLLDLGAILLVVAIGFALYHWVLPPFKDWLPYTESKVLPVVALGVACLICLVLVALLVVPFVLAFHLRKMTGVLRQIEVNLRPMIPGLAMPEAEPELESVAGESPETGEIETDNSSQSTPTSTSA